MTSLSHTVRRKRYGMWAKLMRALESDDPRDIKLVSQVRAKYRDGTALVPSSAMDFGECSTALLQLDCISVELLTKTVPTSAVNYYKLV